MRFIFNTTFWGDLCEKKLPSEWAQWLWVEPTTSLCWWRVNFCGTAKFAQNEATKRNLHSIKSKKNRKGYKKEKETAR